MDDNLNQASVSIIEGYLTLYLTIFASVLVCIGVNTSYVGFNTFKKLLYFMFSARFDNECSMKV